MTVEVGFEVGAELGAEGGELGPGAVGRPFKAGGTFKGSEEALCLAVISETGTREVGFEAVEDGVGQLVGIGGGETVVGVAVGVAEVEELVRIE